MTDNLQKSEDLFLGNLSIPLGARSFVYLIGMVGFPVLLASFVIIQLSSDIKSVDKRLEELALQIDERPMSIDRTTDFVNYLTESLRSELENEVTSLIDRFDFGFKDETELRTKVNLFANELQAVVRPVVRRHQRFAARFPSIGGNLGGYFTLAAPAEDQTVGDTEAYLAALSNKDYAESVTVVIVNFLSQYGHEELQSTLNDAVSSIPSDSQDDLSSYLRAITSALEQSSSVDDVDDVNDVELDDGQFGVPAEISPIPPILARRPVDEGRVIIERELMRRLTKAVINSTTIGLRDQILLSVRLNSSQTLD